MVSWKEPPVSAMASSPESMRAMITMPDLGIF
jgi:hypothetical protein